MYGKRGKNDTTGSAAISGAEYPVLSAAAHHARTGADSGVYRRVVAGQRRGGQTAGGKLGGAEPAIAFCAVAADTYDERSRLDGQIRQPAADATARMAALRRDYGGEPVAGLADLRGELKQMGSEAERAAQCASPSGSLWRAGRLRV
jgi:hypothetical protein